MPQISIGLPKGTIEERDARKGCILGKYTEATFHDKDSRMQVILERVHSYVCGMFLIASTTKYMYYVIFLDDFSRKFWILFMQKKDHMFAKFFEFKALVDKYTGREVKYLRSDNDAEYVSNEFKKFYALKGIRRELIAPHSP